MTDLSDLTGTLDDNARQYLDLLLKGERREASRMILDLVEQGADVRDIYLEVFQPAQYEIGRLWEENLLTVAQEHFVTAATQLIMSQLYPHIFAADRVGRTMVATGVTEDLHEIGVRMVCDFFEMEGWDTYYLGANSPIDSVVSTVRDRKADLIAISVTLGVHLNRVKDMITALRATPDTKDVKIMVGGLPFIFDEKLWGEVGADGFAANAAKAVQTGSELVAANA